MSAASTAALKSITLRCQAKGHLHRVEYFRSVFQFQIRSDLGALPHRAAPRQLYRIAQHRADYAAPLRTAPAMPLSTAPCRLYRAAPLAMLVSALNPVAGSPTSFTNIVPLADF